MYRHFPTKVDLIVAYLDVADTRFWAWFDRAIDPTATPTETSPPQPARLGTRTLPTRCC